MAAGADLRDRHGLGRYTRERILPLAPAGEPVPFRGRIDQSAEPIAFFEEMEASLTRAGGAVWSITGLPGTGKSILARWAAARWGRRFLENPDSSPAVFWAR